MNKKQDLVVKTNQLNQALQTLSLSEVRIIQLAMINSRETATGLSTDKPLRIDASSLRRSLWHFTTECLCSNEGSRRNCCLIDVLPIRILMVSQ